MPDVANDADRFLGKLVVARTGPGELHAVGKCVAYAEFPTVTLQLPNGDQMHWAAHLCRVVDMSQEEVDALNLGPR